MTADRIDFIDKDDAGRVFLGLFEHVAHAACADADKHFHEIGARNGEERHIGLARNRARQQGFTGTGRADQQDTARNTTAQTLEFLRIAQEFDDFFEIFLGFIDASHILECDAAMRLGQQLGLGFAKAHRLAVGSLHLLGQEKPCGDKQHQRQPVDQQSHKPRHAIGQRLGREIHTLLAQAADKGRIIGGIGLEGAAIRQNAVNVRTRNHHGGHAAGIDFRQELAIAHILRRSAL